MINAKELRVGNILMFDETDTVIVTEIYKKKVKFSGVPMARYSKIEATCGLSDLEPVPITESILLNCGFKKRNEGFYEVFHIETWNNIRTVSTVFKITLDDLDGPIGVFISGNHVVHLRSLHQLQNLYFSLTGQELEIKF